MEPEQFYQSVSTMCLQGIIDSYNPPNDLMNKQLRNGDWDITLGTEEVTSTAICLIGLLRSGMVSLAEVNPSKILVALNNASRKHNYPGSLGLILWANAVADGLDLAELLLQAGYPELEMSQFVALLTTMESAWLLSGLLHEYKRLPTESTKGLVLIVLAEVMGRFNGNTAIFCHAAIHAPIKERTRTHIANFADQIYSIQALSYAAIVLQQSATLHVAKSCASHLIELQGPLGQWWWHYNSNSGSVAQPFPVYSVHQHSMAPMALMALTAANGGDFKEVIALSHQWLWNNELGVDLVDMKKQTIWRDIYPKESSLKKYFGGAREVLGFSCAGAEVLPADSLMVNYETRPYEWAWSLFAGAMSSAAPTPPQFIV